MNEQTIFTAVKILVKLLIIGTILMICLNMAWMARAEVATCPLPATLTTDLAQIQQLEQQLTQANQLTPELQTKIQDAKYRIQSQLTGYATTNTTTETVPAPTVVYQTQTGKEWAVDQDGGGIPKETYHQTIITPAEQHYHVTNIERGTGKAIGRIDDLDAEFGFQVSDNLTEDQIAILVKVIEYAGQGYESKLQYETHVADNALYQALSRHLVILLLCGVLVSVPMVLTVYYVSKNFLQEWSHHRQVMAEKQVLLDSIQLEKEKTMEAYVKASMKQQATS